MPIYTYKCEEDKCNTEEFDKIVKYSKRDEDQECPVCGRECERKNVNLTSFRLKGTGWYATDYADKS